MIYFENHPQKLGVRRRTDMKRFAAFALALILIFSMSALASEAQWVSKTTRKCTVYASNSKDSKVLGTLASGRFVGLIATQKGWSKITLNGKTGYVVSSDVSKTTVTRFVKNATLTIYSSNNTSSKKLATATYGNSVKLVATKDSWARVQYGKVEGFCKASGLTDDNPNDLKITCYPKTKTIKVYKAPNSSEYWTVSYKTKMVCTAQYDSTWYRVTNGSNVGYAKKKDLSTTKYDGYSTAECASGKSVEADWFKSNIQYIFYRGKTAVVTDVTTGISWQVSRHGGTNHADVEPLTSDDTAAMKKACGSDYGTWNRRPIWVSINGKKYAASMNCYPHGESSITDNGFDGHYCIHFTNSKTHGTGKVDKLHQDTIKIALKKG